MRIGRDRIGLDGSAAAERPRVYLAMKKPRGVVTSTSDWHNPSAVCLL